MSDKQSNKLHKAVKGTSIAVKVVLVFGGISLLAFFGWLGYSIYIFFGV